jgi:hypothetical protein
MTAIVVQGLQANRLRVAEPREYIHHFVDGTGIGP